MKKMEKSISDTESSKNQDSNLPLVPKYTLFEEIWAIVFIFISLFIFISIQIPNSTGIIGYWLIEFFAKIMAGAGVKYLPVFFIAYAVSYMFFQGKQRWKITLPAFVLAFFAFTVLLELYVFGPINMISWPVSTKGGGIIGTLGLFSLQKTIGIFGAFLAILGLFIISTLLFFDFSILIFCQKLKQYYLAKTAVSDSVFQNDSVLKKEARKGFVQQVIQTILPQSSSEIPMDSALNCTDAQTVDSHSAEDIDFISVEPLQLGSGKENSDYSSEFNKSASEKSEKNVQLVQYLEANTDYQFPSLNLLEKGAAQPTAAKVKDQLLEQSRQATLLEEALLSFGVEASVVNITPGPSVTRFELRPGHGVKISKITALSKDIALKLAAADVRIEAPIPGKSLIGIEVPNLKIETVTLRNIFEKADFMGFPSKLICGVGLTISGDVILMDLAKMPHVLIAGATGSGKSVCINTIILSILLRTRPEEVKFLMIDPKKVELSLYEGIPHLIAPVVTDPNKAAATLKRWALTEMERRYEIFSKIGTKNLEGYNEKIDEWNLLQHKDPEKMVSILKSFFATESDEAEFVAEFSVPPKLPYIVVVIDELADLMMVASQDVEQTICRLAQMARATGIHLVVATQRPSVNVITGLIKANIPSRISFFLQSQIDSRTILDMPGAEKLLGKGDMLYSPVGSFKPLRVQGVYVSEKEVKTVVEFLKKQGTPQYLAEIMDVEPLDSAGSVDSIDSQSDSLFEEAKQIVLSTQYASTSYLQRKLRIGYNRAARLMDELEEQGIISRPEGDRKARSIIPPS